MRLTGLMTMLLTASLMLTAGPVAAQNMCAPRDKVISALGKSYSEVPTARGLSAKGTLVELLTGPDGSWTMIATRPGGVACVVGSGEAWHAVDPMAKVTGKGKVS